MASRELLLQAKCKALVRSRWGDLADVASGGSFAGGAALAAEDTAWVLAEDEPTRSLGGALVWAARHGAGELHLFATGAAGLLARRALGFDRRIAVWRVAGAGLVAADAEPIAPHAALDPRAEPFVELFERAGAEAVVEHGLLRAEVRGLEVARVEVDEAPGDVRLAVGVGKHDREAHRETRGLDQGLDALFEVVRIVADHRVPDGAGHAAFHLSPERWLRSIVVRRPELVGAAGLVVAPSPTLRDDLRQLAAAPAAGHDAATGEPLLVVCSVGADLDLVPSAVDAWLSDGREPRLRFVVPEGDDYRATRDLVAALRVPAELVTVAPDWRSM